MSDAAGIPAVHGRGGGQWDATTYDRIADPMTAWGARVVARTELAGDELVVDAGCGTGRVTELLLERLGPGGRVVGIDRSPAMVAEAGRRLARFGDRVEPLVADLAEPLPVRGVDVILSTATFHWIHDHDGLFANLLQALRPGGVLVAQFGGAGNIAAVDRALDELGRGTGPTGPSRTGSAPRGALGAVHFETPASTGVRLAKAGFADVQAWLEPTPVRFGSRAELETYLRTVILREVVLEVAEDERPALVAAVAGRLPGGEIDYVRLNVTARHPLVHS
jgi:trans-aconitate 2-methyltransferase